MVILACTGDDPASTSGPKSQFTTTATATPSLTPNYTPTPMSLPAPTATPTATPSPTRTYTPSPTSLPTSTATPTATPSTSSLRAAIPSPTPDFFYTGDWHPNVGISTYGPAVGILLFSYAPSTDSENGVVLAVTCVNPSNDDTFIDVTVYTWRYEVDLTAVEVQLAWDDGPTESATWGQGSLGISPGYSASNEDPLAFIDQLSQHDHLSISIESVQGWYEANFSLAGFLGAYQPVKRECFPESIPPNMPTSPTGWTRFNFSQIQAYRYDRESYSPAPQGVYLETLDEDTGDIYRFHLNCTNPGFQYVWSRITLVVPSPDEDTWRGLQDELTLGVEIDGEVISAQDWNRKWNTRSYAGPRGNPSGDVAILEFENIEDTYGLLMEMYKLDAKEVVFTLSGELYNARLYFDVRGFQEALQPMLDHCELSPSD